MKFQIKLLKWKCENEKKSENETATLKNLNRQIMESLFWLIFIYFTLEEELLFPVSCIFRKKKEN